IRIAHSIGRALGLARLRSEKRNFHREKSIAAIFTLKCGAHKQPASPQRDRWFSLSRRRPSKAVSSPKSI
ncbi:hypothetical protein ACSTHP_00155, partial [Vibrio parahaemolyticus]